VLVRAVAWVVVGCMASIGASTSASAADTSPAVLEIVFPEGWSARQMADRVAEVRRIAIERRPITPRLTGAAYTRAVRRARPPRAFRGEAGDNFEGFLFPTLYNFEGHTSAETLIANQLVAFEQRWQTVDLRAARLRGRTPYEVLKEGPRARRACSTCSTADAS
jgi:cell division protein YceG involved in septum cleavage